MRKKRYKLPMKKAWEIQKQLTGNTDKIMCYRELANIAADKLGWPQIEKGQPRERDFAKQYLIKYSHVMEGSAVISPKSWVYFIKSGPFVKIGVSDNVQARLESLQTASPYKLSVIAKIGCVDRRSAFDTEKKIHSLIKTFRVNGEWFHMKCVYQIGDKITGMEWTDYDSTTKAMINKLERFKNKPKDQWSTKASLNHD